MSFQDLTVESPVYTNDQSKQLLKRCLLKKNQNFTSSNSATDIRRIAEDDDDNLGGDKNFSLTRFESSSPLGDCHYDAVVKQNNSLLRRLTRSETRSSFRMKQARKERLEIWGNDFDKLLKDPAGLYAFSVSDILNFFENIPCRFIVYLCCLRSFSESNTVKKI